MNRQQAIRRAEPRSAAEKHRGAAAGTIVISEYDAVIFGAVMILLLFGSVMILSSSYYTAMTNKVSNYDMFYYFFKQLRAIGVGLVVMIAAATINYRIIKPFTIPLYGLANLLLVAVKFFGIESHGARRWLRVPVFGSFQPSEFAKVAVILLLAAYISGGKDRVTTIKGLAGCALIVIIPCVLVYWGKNMSTAIIIAAIGFGMVFIASPWFWPFVGLGLAAVAGLWGYLSYLSMNTDNFRGGRFAAWQNPFADPTGDGYQIIQSLMAVASGGLFGLGLGQSNQKLIFMPEPHNDFIFAIICEELGFVGAMIVLILFAILIWRGVKTALSASDLLGTLIATGAVVLIGVQVAINVAVVTNTIPTTGIPMPFISYGGTSVVFIMALMGVLLNISRYSKK